MFTKKRKTRNRRVQPPRYQKKVPFWKRGRKNNVYRRGRVRGEPTKFWRRAVLTLLGAGALAGVGLGLVVLYYHLLTSPYFCIKENSNIEIEGARRLTPELILKQAGLEPGLSLLALKPSQVERNLLAYSWIGQAECTRKWPDRLVLRIKEREPVALVQLGDLSYVDRQGRLFKPSPGDPHDFPVLTGLTEEDFVQTEGMVPEVLAQAFKLLDILKQTPPPLNLENVSEVHVDKERGYTLYANGLGAAVDLGLNDYPEKLQKFAQIWPVLSQKGYLAKTGRINLDYPQRVLLTVKGMEENP
jgi:cell division protein FtsQ